MSCLQFFQLPVLKLQYLKLRDSALYTFCIRYNWCLLLLYIL